MKLSIDSKGVFQRAAASFRNEISRKSSTFPPEAGRYHLYLSPACPWCQRCHIMLNLKGLENVLSVSFVDPHLQFAQGWKFSDESKTSDPIHKYKFVSEIYLAQEPQYTGRFTVPILFDKKLDQIVSNESAEIIRMLNAEFNSFASNPDADFYPESLRSTIDEVNAWVLKDFNNGVYQAGFSTSQEAYNDAVQRVFEAAERLESLLGTNLFLTGNTLTEVDIRAFPTALRFDPVYYLHFKCCQKRMQDFPRLFQWMKRMYAIPQIRSTVNMQDTIEHYYWSQVNVNPNRIVPKIGWSVSLLEEESKM